METGTHETGCSAPRGNCFDVAIDHGMFNEKSFLGGIEGHGPRRSTVVAGAAPDAIQLPPGTAAILQSPRPGKSDRPALVLRTDIAKLLWHAVPRRLFPEVIERPWTRRSRLGCGPCVVVNLLMLPEQPELYAPLRAQREPAEPPVRGLRHAADGRARW